MARAKQPLEPKTATTELSRLRLENKQLRSRLERIADIANEDDVERFGDSDEPLHQLQFHGFGKRPGLLYDPFFLEGIAAVPELAQADRIHPNAEGVRRNVARLLPLVEKLLAEVVPKDG